MNGKSQADASNPAQPAAATGSNSVYIAGDNAGAVNTGTQNHVYAPGGSVTINMPGERTAPSVPYQAPPLTGDHTLRPRDLALLKQHFLDAGGGLVPVTVGMHGFGGVGKTMLARMFCDDHAVRLACSGGMLWAPIGKNAPDPRAQIADLVVALTGDSNGCATLPGARAQLQAALTQRKALMVIDDVWDEAQIRDMLAASTGCARLITTRSEAVLPFDAILLDVGPMDQAAATRLLGAGLPAGEDARLAQLANRLGRWPVLLRLANRALLMRVTRQKTPLPKALDAAERDLTLKGVVAFDPQRQVLERDQAVSATVEASLELLTTAERQRYAELCIFPQDVPIPLAQAAALWHLTGKLDALQSEALVVQQLDPASLLDYDGGANTLRLHDVLRSFLYANLGGKSALHQCLAQHWGERPLQTDAYAWRWLAYHRAQAAMLNEQPQRHTQCEALVTLVADGGWQRAHENALQDLPALRQSLAYALDAAVTDDTPLGVALIVRAADGLHAFSREHARAEPVFELARRGDLDGARRRSALFDIDDHWRQVLLLTVAWLAPPHKRADARKLCQDVQAQLGPYPALHHLLQWIRADLWGEPVAAHVPLVPDGSADEALIETLLKRVGGGSYDREFIVSRGLDPDVQNPDMPPPTQGIYREVVPGVAGTDDQHERATTRFLAELDGPYLVAYAAADPVKGMDALQRYLSVYTNYNYPEYRFATLWVLLGYVVQLPCNDGRAWVQDAVVGILASAIGGPGVEFEQGLNVAVTGLRARMQVAAARQTLAQQAHELSSEASRFKPGREREGSDIWGHHKRLMLASAQAVGWLLGDKALAAQLLQDALAVGDSGFAGFQAPACWALAEALHVCDAGAADAAIEQALELAQTAAHNVQDPTFCARMTARVNAMRCHWWPAFDPEQRAMRLPQASHLAQMSALHRVGHDYAGRRPDALELPSWAREADDLDGLEKLYRRSKADFLQLNGDAVKQLAGGDAVAVPDAGFVPHVAARLAAEVLARAGDAPLAPEHMQLLRRLVPFAVISPTALDAVLTRLVLAQARNDPQPALADALDAALARRPSPLLQADPGSELTTIIPRLPA